MAARGWISRVFGSEDSPVHARKRKDPGVLKAAGRVQKRMCGNCHGPVGAAAHRCPHCGYRLAHPNPPRTDDRPDPGRPEPDDPEPGRRDSTHDLSDLERRILIAVLGAPVSTPAIHVLPTAEVREGEIKAGEQRLYGTQAVQAVEALSKAGYVARRGEDLSYGLTEAGARLAVSLQHSPSGHVVPSGAGHGAW